MRPEPEGLRIIKAKLELAKTVKLTAEDGQEVDDALKKCHEAYPQGCGYREECRRWDNLLSNFLPTYKPKAASHKRETDIQRYSNSLPQISSGKILSILRERAIY